MLDPGPSLLPNIFDVLIRFQLGQIGIVVDIKKAFLQISIDKNYRDFLLTIWHVNVFDPTPTIKILRFARLVFGLTSSSFILNGAGWLHLEKYMHDENIKDIIQKLIRDLYVDNVTSSFENQTEVAIQRNRVLAELDLT